MNTSLIYDVETTGFPDWHRPSGEPQQPHMVQLAASLVDDETRAEIAGMNVIIRPDGWTIPAASTKVHGINTDYALKVGIPEILALELFLALWEKATVRVAHNEQFDARIIRIATKRYASETMQNKWKEGNKFCTMRSSTNILKLPKANGKSGHKFPKLEEAYRYFIGGEPESPHSAHDDVLCCAAVYWSLREL